MGIWVGDFDPGLLALNFDFVIADSLISGS